MLAPIPLTYANRGPDVAGRPLELAHRRADYSHKSTVLMLARQLHRRQMRAEDPAFLVLHLDTNAAPAVDGSHDNAAPRRGDARADSLEAHTVAALELLGHFFRSFEAQGTWCAGAALPPSG